jgi:hypothetical protein
MALDLLVRGYRVLLSHFEHIRESRVGTAEVQGRATFISKKLKDYNFLYVLFVLDILKVLNVLSLKMQEDDLTISRLFDALVAVTFSLVELKTLNGSELSDFINAVQNDLYKYIQLKNVNQDDHSREKEVIIDLILAAFASRFESMEKDPILKAATTILTLSDWPENRNQLPVFGNEEIALLLEHFHEILERNGCNLDAIMDQNGEWKDIKAFVFRHRTTVKFENFFIFPDLRCRFRNMIFLLELLLSFPLSSAVCERGFSAMKRILNFTMIIWPDFNYYVLPTYTDVVMDLTANELE